MSNVESLYSTEEASKLEQAFEDLAEDDWLEVVYGPASSLPNEEWLDQVMSPEGRFVFDATVMRAKIFEKASVSVKHIDASRILSQ